MITLSNSLRRSVRSSLGFTMIELLMYMGLLAIFLVVLTDMFVSILDIQSESESTSAVEQDAKFLVSRLKYDVARASSITTPAALGSSSPSLVLVIGGVTYTYAVSGGNLTLTTNLGTSALNSSGTTVSAPSFQKLGTVGSRETVKLQLTLSSTTIHNAGPETTTIQTTVGRR